MKSKIYILCLILVVLLIGGNSFAQINIGSISPNCSNLTSVQLSATFTGFVPSSTGLSADDNFDNFVIPLGFTFSFYGTDYTKCIVGGNGTIGFDTTLAGAYEAWSIVSASPMTVPGNVNCNSQILGCYSDIYTPAGGNVSYATVGTAPNRMFVVTFCDVPMFAPSICPDDSITFQMVLYETSNNIEVHITRKQTCTWNGGLAIQGLQDPTGTYGIATPGRNATVWTAYHDAERFTPTSPTVTTSYSVTAITYAPIPYAFSNIYWYAGGVLVDSGNNLTVSPVDTTIYTAMAFGCNDTTISTVIVPGIHNYDSSHGLAIVVDSFTFVHLYGCTQDTVVFNNLSTPVGPSYTGYTSYWNFGDGSPIDSSNPNPVHIYTAMGTYSVTSIYASPGGCADTTYASIIVSHQLIPSFYAVPDSICMGQSITFNNTSIAGLPVYVWNFQDYTPIDTAISPSHTYNTPGNFNVLLTVTDSLGCVATANEFVYVGAIQALITHDTSVCLAGRPLQLYPTVVKYDSSLFSSYTYLWTPSGNLDNGSVQQPFFSGIGDFTYVFTATTIPLGCTSSDTETIHSYPPVTFTGLTANTTISAGSSIQLNADGGHYYMWAPDNGTLNNNNINDPIATPVDSITTYSVYGMSIYGCPDTANITITLQYNAPEFMPTAFSPNNDGLNDVFKPGNLKNSKLVDFRVYNRWGQQIFQTANPSIGWDGTFNGTPQDIGTYNYSVIIEHTDGIEQVYNGSVTLIR